MPAIPCIDCGPQAIDSGPPDAKPILVTITPLPGLICPPGYHMVYYGGNEFPQLWYCELDPTPTPSPLPQANDPGPLESNPATPFPPIYANDGGDSGDQSALDIVQYCANNGANLGGVNITFAKDHTLHVNDWFSENPGQVACADDISNPRTCWGPESETFDVMLCNTDMVQNNAYGCKTLPVTLGACNHKERGGGEPDPIPPPVPHR